MLKGEFDTKEKLNFQQRLNLAVQQQEERKKRRKEKRIVRVLIVFATILGIVGGYEAVRHVFNLWGPTLAVVLAMMIIGGFVFLYLKIDFKNI
jgi:ABC-type enterochelin transport system permease subunit